MAFEDLDFKPPIHAIRVKTCGNDWVTDCDAICAYQDECEEPPAQEFCIEQIVKWLREEAEKHERWTI